MACGFLVPCHASHPPSPGHKELGRGHCGCRQHRAPRGIVSLHMDSASQSRPCLSWPHGFSGQSHSRAGPLDRGKQLQGAGPPLPLLGSEKETFQVQGQPEQRRWCPRQPRGEPYPEVLDLWPTYHPPPTLFLQQKKAFGGGEICPRLHGKEEELKYPPGALTSGRANCTDLL